MCGYQWCWVCEGPYNYTHVLTCNPFGCKIGKESIVKSKCIRVMVFIFYILFVILLIPIALLFFIPVSLAYLSGKGVFRYFISN